MADQIASDRRVKCDINDQVECAVAHSGKSGDAAGVGEKDLENHSMKNAHVDRCTLSHSVGIYPIGSYSAPHAARTELLQVQANAN